MVATGTAADGTYNVLPDDETSVNVHHIILATGYVPNMANVVFPDRAAIVRELHTIDGSPVLNTEFQTNLPNLYVTGLAAMQDFGPFLDSPSPVPLQRESFAKQWQTANRQRLGSMRREALNHKKRVGAPSRWEGI